MLNTSAGAAANRTIQKMPLVLQAKRNLFRYAFAELLRDGGVDGTSALGSPCDPSAQKRCRPGSSAYSMSRTLRGCGPRPAAVSSAATLQY